jgi:cytochrome b-561
LILALVVSVFFFFVLAISAILVHKWLPGSRGFKKSVHLCLQGLALACGIFGIWTKFHGNDGIVANFFSLHSWMGLICISLFGAQVFFTPGFILLVFTIVCRLFIFTGFFAFLFIWK